MLRSFCLLAVSLLLLAPTRQARADGVDRYVESEMRQRRIPGLSLAVLRHGKIVKRKYYGLADLEHRVPVRAETVYPIASITKIFTSSAVLSLAEEGRLKLNDRIGDLLPGLPESWQAVTVRQCLSHTSGLPDSHKSNHRFWQDPNNETAVHQLTARMPFEFSPGTGCAYNQTGFQLLARIVERISGRPLQEFVSDRFLKRAAMTGARYTEYSSPQGNTYFTPVVPDLVSDYQIVDGTLRRAAYYHPKWDRGTAGLQLTLEDLVRWEQAVRSGRVLKPASLQEAWAPARLNDGSPVRLFWASYGLGWIVGEMRGHRYAGHLGGDSVWYGRFPDEELCVIVLTNLDGCNPADLALTIADRYLPAPKVTTRSAPR